MVARRKERIRTRARPKVSGSDTATIVASEGGAGDRGRLWMIWQNSLTPLLAVSAPGVEHRAGAGLRG